MRKKLVGALLCASMTAGLLAGTTTVFAGEGEKTKMKHARLGYLEKLDDLGGKYSDAGTSVYSYDGSVYALPGISWFEGIYYNKTMFEENEIELPATFDEYIEVCKKFQEKDIIPLAAGLKSWEPMLKNSMAFVTAEYLSTEEGKAFGEKYRNGEATLDGTWNTYLEKWSEMIKEDRQQCSAPVHGILRQFRAKIRILLLI